MPDFGNPLESIGAPLALLILILMGSRFSRVRTGDSRDIGSMMLLLVIVAAGFFWVYAALGLLARFTY
ncbi:MAG TPA: hypothetical protein VGL35_05105 [Rhizomicrobium sp.]|jgi:hypothetical protein